MIHEKTQEQRSSLSLSLMDSLTLCARSLQFSNFIVLSDPIDRVEMSKLGVMNGSLSL